jgi:hypothetical protein
MRKPVKKRQRAPGGGRKPSGKKRMTYKLLPTTIERVKRCAQAAAISQSEYVEAAVLEKLKADERRQSATRKQRRIIKEPAVLRRVFT